MKIGKFLNFLAESRCFIFLSSNVMADILQRAMYRHHASHFRETPSKINVNSIQIWLPPSPPCQINAFSCRISGTALLFRRLFPNNDEKNEKQKAQRQSDASCSRISGTALFSCLVWSFSLRESLYELWIRFQWHSIMRISNQF